MEHMLFFTAVAMLIVYFLRRCVLRRDLRDRDGHPIPPGPPIRFPFLPRYPERILHSWTKKYGPIYSVWMGNQLFVVLNEPTVVRDLLVLNGANFSGRWNYFMKNETILKGGAITATPYNDTWLVSSCYDAFFPQPHYIGGNTEELRTPYCPPRP